MRKTDDWTHSGESEAHRRQREVLEASEGKAYNQPEVRSQIPVRLISNTGCKKKTEEYV